MTGRWTLPHSVLLAAIVVAVAAATAASCVPGASTSSIQANTRAVVEVLDALQPGRAVLVNGSRLVKGLPGFGRNALPALSGEYVYLQIGQKPATGNLTGTGTEDGNLRVTVWFTREPLVYPDEWKTTADGLKPCTTLPTGISLLATLKLDEATTLWALGSKFYTLFVGIPGTIADPCHFTSVFSERFLFFQRYAERPEDTSFPAILDIGR